MEFGGGETIEMGRQSPTKDLRKAAHRSEPIQGESQPGAFLGVLKGEGGHRPSDVGRKHLWRKKQGKNDAEQPHNGPISQNHVREGEKSARALWVL